MPAGEFISFPPGGLFVEPVRIPVLLRTPDWYVLAKPAGVVVTETPLHPEAPVLKAAIDRSLAAGKAQLSALGITRAEAVTDLDLDATGCVLFANTADVARDLRNALGSNRFEFIYDLVSENRRGAHLGSEVECRLPLIQSERSLRMVVSRTAGRKCATHFVRVKEAFRYSIWEARCAYSRPHQIRAHAAECGLRIPGEMTYTRVRLVCLSALKRGYREGGREERPLHAPLCLHLGKLRFPGAAGDVLVEAPQPRSLAVLIRRVIELG